MSATGGGATAAAGMDGVDTRNMPRSKEEMEERQRKQKEQEEAVEGMLRQICTPSALDRLKRVELVKPELAGMVKMSLVQKAQRGQIKEKVSDSTITAMLEQVSGRFGKSKVVSVRVQRKGGMDSDEDDDDLLEGL